MHPLPTEAAQEGLARDASRAGLFVAWMILAMGALGLQLGDHALIDPDEGRNAVIAAQMVASGDYVVPRLNGLPYLDKPPLFFAAEALALRLLGRSELAVRAPALLAAWATVLLTAWFARKLFGGGTGWVAGTACATAPLFIGLGRIAIFDSMLSFFVTLSLVAFYRAVESAPGAPGASERRLWSLAAWGAIALGVLTKGPVALALPLLVAVPYAFWRRRPVAVWLPLGPALVVLLVVPWVLAVERQVPGFVRYALVTETWARLTSDQLDRSGPLWYFVPFVVGGCFPWVVMVGAAAIERARRDIEPWQREIRPALVFLALWVVLPLLFFSLSQSKRPHYVLPLVPAFSLLTAWAWSRGESWTRGVRWSCVVMACLGAVLVAVGVVDRDWPADPPSVEIARGTALALGGVILVSSVLAWLGARRRALSVVALSLPLVAAPSITASLLAEVARVRSGKELAAAARPHVEDGAQIAGIETYSPSLSFYLDLPIHVSSSTGAPLRSNYVLGAYREWVGRESSMLHPPEWWPEVLRTCTVPTIFLLKSRYHREQELLAEAGAPTLFTGLLLVAMGPCGSAGSAGSTGSADEPSRTVRDRGSDLEERRATACLTPGDCEDEEAG